VLVSIELMAADWACKPSKHWRQILVPH